MNQAQGKTARQTLALIREDIVGDVRRLEGAPFDGRTVAKAFGNLAAQVDSLAHLLYHLLDEADDGLIQPPHGDCGGVLGAQAGQTVTRS